MKKIALISHDDMKPEMIAFAKKNEHILAKYPLVATGTTGLRLMENTNLTIQRFKSGPLGGDQQIGAEVAVNNIEAILFFRDPLSTQPHEPDIYALIRLADVHRIPIATNPATAELLIMALDK